MCLLASPSYTSAQQPDSGDAQRHDPIEYALRDLGSLDDAGLSVAVAINDRGEIAGWGRSSSGVGVPFYWSESTGFIKNFEDLEGVTVDINEAGKMVGWFSRDFIRQGFLWSLRHGLVELGPFIPTAINDRGDIAGQCGSENGIPCVLSASGVLRRLSVPEGAFGFAADINNRGDVVGDITLNSRSRVGLWRRHQDTLEILEPTPDEQLEWVIPLDINDRGMIVGTAEVFGSDMHLPVIWEPRGDGVVIESVPGQTTNINNHGVVTLMGELPFRTLVWDLRRGTFSELPKLGGLDEPVVYGLNDRGQIVGHSSTPAGENHAVIWEPVRPPTRTTR
jgi:uncharacterized membrane protein